MKSLRGSSPGVGICALIAAVAAAGGSGAAAARPASPGEIVVPGGGSARAIGTCPKGTRAISGGFEAPGFQTDGPTTIRTTSARLGARRWRTNASGLSQHGGAGSILTRVYCQSSAGAEASRIRVRTASVTVAPRAIGSTTARCRPGESAISGGFGAPGFGPLEGSHVVALTSRRAGKRAWRVEAANFNFDDTASTWPGELVAYAYCRRGGPRLVASRASAEVEDGNGRSVEAICRPGTKAISGGFDANLRGTPGGISASGAIGSVRLPLAAGWRTTAVSVTGDAGATATAFAYCQ